MKLNRLLTLILLTTLCFTLAALLTSCGDKCDHEWSEWAMLDEDASICEDGGEQYRICAKDETHVEYRTVEPAGHAFGGEYHAIAGGHYQNCQNPGCDKRNVEDHVSGGEATYESAEYCSVCNYEMSPKLHMLQNKKIIFIGDSFVYFGNTVTEKKQSVQLQANRSNDKGYFYQLCRENGANVEVTNWTYGGHGLSTHLQQNCTHREGCNGTCHIEDLTDRYFDIVILSGGRGNAYAAETFFNEIDTFVEIFRSVNPNVKFVYLVSSGAHGISTSGSSPKEVLNSLDVLEDEYGFTIVDWGKLVKDLIDGTAVIEGSELEYVKTTFAIAKTDDDGHHPNPLAGYITTLMTYCAITGESAVGQEYEFCSDRWLNTYFNFKEFISKNYVKDSTNFDKVFESEHDMLAIQQLIDKYLAEKSYRNYNFE